MTFNLSFLMSASGLLIPDDSRETGPALRLPAAKVNLGGLVGAHFSFTAGDNAISFNISNALLLNGAAVTQPEQGAGGQAWLRLYGIFWVLSAADPAAAAPTGTVLIGARLEGNAGIIEVPETPGANGHRWSPAGVLTPVTDIVFTADFAGSTNYRCDVMLAGLGPLT